jgi:hypothetical protein
VAKKPLCWCGLTRLRRGSLVILLLAERARRINHIVKLRAVLVRRAHPRIDQAASLEMIMCTGEASWDASN